MVLPSNLELKKTSIGANHVLGEYLLSSTVYMAKGTYLVLIFVYMMHLIDTLRCQSTVEKYYSWDFNGLTCIPTRCDCLATIRDSMMVSAIAPALYALEMMSHLL